MAAIELKAVQVGDISSATNISNARRVRVYNSHTADILITLKNQGGTTLGTVTLAAGGVIELLKAPTDTIEGGTSGQLLATPFSVV